MDTIGGEKIKEPIDIEIEGVKGGRLPPDKRCVIRGYESVRMIGLPDEVAKAEHLSESQAAWQMQRYVVMTSALEPKELQKP